VSSPLNAEIGSARGFTARDDAAARGPRALLWLLAVTVIFASFGGEGRAATAVDVAQQPAPAFLVALARHAAAGLGDAHPTSAVYVATRRLDAVGLSSGDAVNTNQPVYLVVLTGNFVATAASFPPGGHAPTGTVASLVVAARDGRDLDFGLSSQHIDVPKLGRAVDLLPYMDGKKTPMCGLPDLHVSASFQGATGSALGSIVVRNVGGLTCTLPASPTIRLSWHKHPLIIRQVRFPSGWLARMDPHWATPLHLLAPGESGRVVLQWSNWCGARPWGKGPFRPLVELKLPGQPGIVAAHVGAMSAPSCDAPSAARGQASTIRVSPFVSPPG
jgi:hypothetical protein